MSAPQPGGPWVARAFTRARKFQRVLLRPFGNNALELPFEVTFRQVAVAIVGTVTAVVVGITASQLGFGAWPGWVVGAVVALIVVVLTVAPVPNEGGYEYVEGFMRASWLAMPFTSSRTSSRPNPRSVKTKEHLAARVSFGPAPYPQPERSEF